MNFFIRRQRAIHVLYTTLSKTGPSHRFQANIPKESANLGKKLDVNQILCKSNYKHDFFDWFGFSSKFMKIEGFKNKFIQYKASYTYTYIDERSGEAQN